MASGHFGFEEDCKVREIVVKQILLVIRQHF